MNILRMAKMAVLSLAAFTRREQVTAAINSGEPRPLAYQPDWLIGWGIMRYEKDMNPGARIFYNACANEWRLRREIAAGKRLDEERAGMEVWTRWKLEVPARLLVVGTTEPFAAAKIPGGSKIVQRMVADHGNIHVYIIDAPFGKNITPVHPDVKATAIGAGASQIPKG